MPNLSNEGETKKKRSEEYVTVPLRVIDSLLNRATRSDSRILIEEDYDEETKKSKRKKGGKIKGTK